MVLLKAKQNDTRLLRKSYINLKIECFDTCFFEKKKKAALPLKEEKTLSPISLFNPNL